MQEDRDIAALLGLSKAAFSARKARDSFPKDKLLALVSMRPDLKIDVGYVLTGDQARVLVMPTERTCDSEEEALLLARFRASPRDLRDAALRVLLGGDQIKPAKPGRIKQTVSGTANQVVGINKGVVNHGEKPSSPGGKRKR